MDVTGTPIRVMLVDTHDVFRIGLKTLLHTASGFAVVGEAGTAAAAIEEARHCQPDVVIMDVRLPDTSGIELCREIRAALPHTRAVMLTSYADEDNVLTAILAGADGYLLKESASQSLVEAITTVARGGWPLDSSVTRPVIEWIRRHGGHGPIRRLDTLSEQERRILSLIAEGKTNCEIAAALCLSEHTVRTHVSHVLRKLGLSRRAEAAAYLAERRARAEFPLGSPRKITDYLSGGPSDE